MSVFASTLSLASLSALSSLFSNRRLNSSVSHIAPPVIPAQPSVHPAISITTTSAQIIHDALPLFSAVVPSGRTPFFPPASIVLSLVAAASAPGKTNVLNSIPRTKMKMKMKKRFRHLCFDTGGVAAGGAAVSDGGVSAGGVAAMALSTGGTSTGVGKEEERFLRCCLRGDDFFFTARGLPFVTGFFVTGVFFFFEAADDDAALVFAFILLLYVNGEKKIVSSCLNTRAFCAHSRAPRQG